MHFQPDVSGNYRRRARAWLSADFLLEGRLQSPGGFWVPAPHAAFAYYLVKRLDKLALDEARLGYLHGLFMQTPQACEATARRLLGNAGWDTLWSYLSQGRGGVPAPVLKKLQGELVAHAPRERPGQVLRMRWREVRRLLRRIMHPTGLVIAVLGPDGAGKTTVIEGMRAELAQVFRRTDYFHLRPRVLRRSGAGTVHVTDPHALPPRGQLASLAKLALFVADTWIGYVLRVSALKRRSSLVIFDRYAQDMLADPIRYRLSTPRWLNRALLWPVPKPDLWLVLDAPAAVLLGRKAEVSPAACEAQLAGYRYLLDQLPDAVQIDTAQSPQASVAAACEAVLARMRSRLVKPVA